MMPQAKFIIVAAYIVFVLSVFATGLVRFDFSQEDTHGALPYQFFGGHLGKDQGAATQFSAPARQYLDSMHQIKRSRILRVGYVAERRVDIQAVSLLHRVELLSPAESFQRGRMLLLNGENEDDWAQGVALLREAWNGGYIPAGFGLAAAYEDGRGVAQSDELSLMWLRRSADEGYADAQIALARKYLEDRKADIDIEEAKRLLEAAYDQGEAMGAFLLGELYGGNYAGHEAEWHTDLQLLWMTRAAELGMGWAAFTVGYINEQYLRSPDSVVEAYKWYIISDSLGEGVEKSYLEQGLKSLSSEQRTEARTRAEEWFAKHPEVGVIRK